MSFYNTYQAQLYQPQLFTNQQQQQQQQRHEKSLVFSLNNDLQNLYPQYQSLRLNGFPDHHHQYQQYAEPSVIDDRTFDSSPSIFGGNAYGRAFSESPPFNHYPLMTNNLQDHHHHFQPLDQQQVLPPPLPPHHDPHELYYDNPPMLDETADSPPSRTVYLGNIPSDIAANELLDYVRLGVLELVKILPQKNCAFISFVDPQLALLFHSDCILKKLCIKGSEVRVGWGKNTLIMPQVLEAIECDRATRNVYLGNLTGGPTKQQQQQQQQPISEEELRHDLAAFGPIDCIKIIPEKGIAFIHFLSILSAMRCVSNLPSQEKYANKKCSYGKDRCAFITKTQQHNAAQYLGLAPGMEHVVTAADRDFISTALVQQLAAAAQIATQAGGAHNLGNRTVYLGNLHQESLVEEICNVVRGGLLHSVRFLKERHVCFVTFVDPIAAAQFFAMCQLHGLTIHNRRIKVGWGKHLGPLSNALSLAVSNGALRNIYIGNISDFKVYDTAKLRHDFGKFGDIEQVNFLEEKNCAFINFVNISNAIKAIDGIKSFPDYKTLKVNFGKDRCGNLPRQFQNSGPNSGPNSGNHRQHRSHDLINSSPGENLSVPVLSPVMRLCWDTFQRH